MLGSDEKIQPGFVDFSNFAQGINFVSREAISEAREFSIITLQVGFHQSWWVGFHQSWCTIHFFRGAGVVDGVWVTVKEP